MIALLAPPALAQGAEPVTVGFGVGVIAPGPLAPSVASARVRLSEGFSVSPVFGYTFATTVVDEDGVETRTRDVDLGIGAEALGAVGQRGPALLQLVGGVEFAADTVTVRPDAPDELRTEERTGEVYYGFGVEWFLGGDDPHVSVSAHALNPVLTLERTRVIAEPGSPEDSSSLAVGAVWDPTVRFMVHLYL